MKTGEQKEGKGCDRAYVAIFILLVILVGYAIYSEQARKELEDSLQIQVEQLRKELQEELVKMSAERIEEATTYISMHQQYEEQVSNLTRKVEELRTENDDLTARVNDLENRIWELELKLKYEGEG